jgi:hypothetical protein
LSPRSRANQAQKQKPSKEGAPGGPGMPGFGFPLPPLKFRTAGFPQYGFKWTVNGDLRRFPKA